MRKNLLLLAALAFVSLFVACKKDSTPSKTELLTSHNWQLTALTCSPEITFVSTSGTVTSNDYYKNGLKNCEKDDFYTFYADNNVVRNNGTNRCLDSEPATTSGTWSFKAGETQLEIAVDGTTRLYSITSLTADEGVLSYTGTVGASTYTFTATWKKP